MTAGRYAKAADGAGRTPCEPTTQSMVSSAQCQVCLCGREWVPACVMGVYGCVWMCMCAFGCVCVCACTGLICAWLAPCVCLAHAQPLLPMECLLVREALHSDRWLSRPFPGRLFAFPRPLDANRDRAPCPHTSHTHTHTHTHTHMHTEIRRCNARLGGWIRITISMLLGRLCA